MTALVVVEAQGGLRKLDTYRQLQSRAETIKHKLLAFLIEKSALGKCL